MKSGTSSILARVDEARQRLLEAGVSPNESALDARLLAEHTLGWTAERYFTDANQSEPDDFLSRYAALIARRTAREPVAYIIGRREFWELEFEVTPAVLIPRPSTEFIVEAVLDLFRDPSAPLKIADVCTGCGCVAVAIAHEHRAATVTATDISEAALDVARRNATRHGVADRVTFARSDLLGGVAGTFDVIVANPPYVVDEARPVLQPEVRDYEPGVALFGGNDGLGVITRLVAAAPSRLRPGGYFIFEFGFGQDVEVEQLLERAPALTLLELRRDLDGIARTAVARKL
ncbi:MAG: peptide chain release factor N(5)-glutamine methyltransferase [Acidobacteria bacterium]|nr:peptide chain release factor N(5)-glutamine methyltransferase [Acidobacteriota bacterium]